MELRPYQKAAVEAVYTHLRTKDNNPCVVIPTGGGKTPVLATIVSDAIQKWNGRVMIVSHVKELLEQATDKIKTIYQDADVGIFSSGLKSWETDHKCIVAGIQSVYKNAEKLGHFDLIIVDEAHLIPVQGEGMYRKFLADMKEINPILRVIGLTATPYRMSTGTICSDENILNEICYEIGIRELMDDGYLSKIVSKSTKSEIDLSSVHIKGGEFIESEAEAIMAQQDVIVPAINEVCNLTKDRKSVLIFCCGVKHAEKVVNRLRELDYSAELILGDTLPGFREQHIEDFKSGKLKFLVNVGVLTTGFDAPNVDCVVLLRPTMSPGLYYQMVGRGFRLHPEKKDCLILDFGNNIVRHGPIDRIEPKAKRSKGEGPLGKVCPECQEVVLLSSSICPACGHNFMPKPKKTKIEKKPSQAAILSGEVNIEELEVKNVRYTVHQKRDAPPDWPRTVKVDYEVGLFLTVTEWLCPEHTGYAKRKFLNWWREHASGCELPVDAKDCVWLCNEGAVDMPTHIKVKTVSGQKYPEIVGYIYPEKEPFDPNEEIPF